MPLWLVKTAGAGDLPEADWTGELLESYPDDLGAAAPILLNLVLLQPGDGLFVRPGTLHSYLDGNGFEVMSSSDNVVRGGLTSKHVDQNALETISLRTPQSPDIISPRIEDAGVRRYAMEERGVDEFEVRAISLDTNDDRSAIQRGATSKPSVILCVEGSAQVRSTTGPAGSRSIELCAGASAWIPACAGPTRISSNTSARLFEVRVP